MPLHLVQLTDTHLLAEPDGVMLGVPVRDSLRRVVEAIQHDGAPSPDLALVTGDLSQDGSPASYEAMGHLMAPLGVPCYGLPGNHDAKSALRRALARPPFRPHCVFESGGWRFVLLDSAVPGAVHGAFSEASLDALDATLSARSDVPTLVALHHGPFPVGAAWLDPINLRDPEGFRQVVEQHPHVRLVLFGHIHQAAEARWGNTHLYSCPSTGFQFAPQTDTFAVDDVPPGYRRVTLHADGPFATTLRRVSALYARSPSHRLLSFFAMADANANMIPAATHQADRLLAITLELNRMRDPDALLDFIIETAADVLDCEATSVLLYDDATDRLHFAAATGSDPDALAEIPVPLRPGRARRDFGEVDRDGAARR